MSDATPQSDWKKRLFVWLQYTLPHHLISRLTLKVTRSQRRWLKNRLIHWFIRQFDVDMREAKIEDPGAYSDFNAFFTRELKEDARPLTGDNSTILCPVDGAVSELGAIQDNHIFQAKGHDYSLQQLLGGHEDIASLFNNGTFATLYLSPRDYHRIHMPTKGTLQAMVYVPGRLFSVNPTTVNRVPRLFARNERVISLFNTEVGSMAVIMVGAINVACIQTTWHGVVTPPQYDQIKSWQYQKEPAISYARGDEIGRFNMGSTVIVLFQHGRIELDSSLSAGCPVRMGQTLAMPK